MNKQRRSFITGTSSILTLAALTPNIPGVIASEEKKVNQSLVVYRTQEQNSLQFASVFAEAGSSVMALSIDPVRQWRDGFSVALKEKRKLIGLTNWSDYMLMRELAREHKLFPVLEMQHQVSQVENANWALAEANEILHFSQIDELQNMNAQTTKTINGKSLFSWVIA